MKNACRLKAVGAFMVGGITHQAIRATAKSVKNIVWTKWVDDIMNSTLHLPRRFEVEVVRARLRIDLAKNTSVNTLRPMYEEALSNGYCFCPVSLAFEILLQHKRRGLINEAFLAMKPIPCVTESGITQGEIISIQDKIGPWSKNRSLHVTPAGVDDFADGGYSYLFCRKNQNLVKAGFANTDF